MELNKILKSAPDYMSFDFIFSQNSKNNNSSMGDKMVQEYIVDLLRNIPSGIIAYNQHGKITISNVNAIHFLGIKSKQEDLFQKPILDVINQIRIRKAIQQSIENGMEPFEIPLLYIKGKSLQLIAKKFNSEILLAIQDITVNNKIKNEATKSLLLGQEIERKRIAREIHDGIGPVMSTIKLRLDSVRRKTMDEAIRKNLNLIDEMISETAREIRAISHSLMPSTLVDFGLSVAIDNMVQNYQEAGVKINFSHNIEHLKFDEEFELHIFRIVQELANNGVKHAGGHLCDIKILSQLDFIEIRYSDQGKGFDTQLPYKGIGLSNIKNRVQILGGNIEVASSDGNGVQILINIPHKNQQQ